MIEIPADLIGPQRPGPLTEVHQRRRELMVHLYRDARLSTVKIARLLHLTPKTVRFAMLRAGCRLRPLPRWEFSGEQLNAMARLYEEEGWTITELVGRFGSSRATIRTALRAQGVVLTGRGRSATPAPETAWCARAGN